MINSVHGTFLLYRQRVKTAGSLTRMFQHVSEAAYAGCRLVDLLDPARR